MTKVPITGQPKVSGRLRTISTEWWSNLLDELDEKGSAIAMFSDSIVLMVSLADDGFHWEQVDVKRFSEEKTEA